MAPVGMKPITVTSASFEQDVLESPIPVIIDFWAPWCGPCRTIAPILDELAGSYAGAVKVVKINADDHPDLAIAFGVRGLPTLAALRGRVRVGEIRGFQGRKPIVALFEQLASRAVVQRP